MKYKRILSVSIPIGILLSSCVVTPSPKSLANIAATPHTKPLPHYVKHNPIMGPAARKTPMITVQLIEDSHHDMYIRYIITDELGRPGSLHSDYTHNNESSHSTLFKKRFPSGPDITVQATADGEVTIEGTATDGKCYKWKSDSLYHSDADSKNSDVRWNSIPCQ